MRLHLLYMIYFKGFTGYFHDLISGSVLTSFFLVPSNDTTIQLMLGISAPDDRLASKSKHWYTLCFGNTSNSDLTMDALTPHYIWINKLMAFITIYDQDSYTDTAAVMITATNISGYHATWILTALTWFVGPPTKLNGGIFTTGIGFSASILYFWIHPLTGGTALLLPVISVLPRKLLLMNYPHNFTSKILWHCFIMTSCHTLPS